MTLFTMLLVLIAERLFKLGEHWQLDHRLEVLFRRIRHFSMFHTLGMTALAMLATSSVLVIAMGFPPDGSVCRLQLHRTGRSPGSVGWTGPEYTQKPRNHADLQPFRAMFTGVSRFGAALPRHRPAVRRLSAGAPIAGVSGSGCLFRTLLPAGHDARLTASSWLPPPSSSPPPPPLPPVRPQRPLPTTAQRASAPPSCRIARRSRPERCRSRCTTTAPIPST